MTEQWKFVPIDSLGVIAARGVDAVSFLQGQLSNDITKLDATHSLLAGYHNPQGRVIALLRLVRLDETQILAIVPRELAAAVTARLAKFVLRAKVKLSDESEHWQVRGLVAGSPADAPLAQLPTAANGVERSGRALVVCAGPGRWLVLEPAGQGSVLAALGESPEALWHAAAIAAGEPQVRAATSESFVAQMLNLDVLGAIAFEKGCYTGQEVIARAHYRGRVKRRLQRFLTAGAAALKPGDAGQLSDGRQVKVVEGVQRADGRCEFLGVAGFAGAAVDEAEPVPALAQDSAGSLIDAQPLPLPYGLPG